MEEKSLEIPQAKGSRPVERSGSEGRAALHSSRPLDVFRDYEPWGKRKSAFAGDIAQGSGELRHGADIRLSILPKKAGPVMSH
jgi:hypothetical protein